MAKHEVKRIGVGIIGCGGQIQGILGRIPELGGRIQVSALCDPSRQAIDATRKNYAPNAVVYKDYRDLAKAEDVDWVLIGSLNKLHAAHCIAAFRAGKNVFCEKPLATNVADLKAVRNEHLKSGTSFVIGFTLRFSPHYMRIKELVANGKIGEIISMEFNETLEFNHGAHMVSCDWRRFSKISGGHMMEKCCHDIDLANWIVESHPSRVASFGGLNFFVPKNKRHVQRIGANKDGLMAYWAHKYRPVKRNPFTCKKDVVDNQVAILEYANGVRAAFHTNCNAGIQERRMYILGTEGALRADVLCGRLETRRIGFDTASEDFSTDAKGGHGGGDAVLALDLVACMLEGAQPRVKMEDGLMSSMVVLAIEEARKKGKVVDVKYI